MLTFLLQRSKLTFAIWLTQTHKHIKVSVSIVTAVELKHLVKTAHTHASLLIVGIAGMTLDHFQGDFSGDIRLETDRQTDRHEVYWRDGSLVTTNSQFPSFTLSTPTTCPSHPSPLLTLPCTLNSTDAFTSSAQKGPVGVVATVELRHLSLSSSSIPAPCTVKGKRSSSTLASG